MPDQEISLLEQQAVLWPATGAFDIYGQAVIGSPGIIPVAWKTGRSITKDPKGDTVVLDATAVVDRRIAPLSRIWLAPGTYVAGAVYPAADPGGALSAWFGTGSGTGSGAGLYPDSELMEVAVYREIPDVKGRTATRTIGMVRFRGHP